MKIVEVKCPNCGASLTVKGNRKEMYCESCGAKFLLDNEVSVVKHVNAGEITEEQEFINAETYLNTLKRYSDAYSCYLSLARRYVDNKEVWLGLLRSYTHDFTNVNVSESLSREYWENYKALADEEEVSVYKTQFLEYNQKIQKQISYGTNHELTKGEFKYFNLLIIIFLGPLGVHKFVKGEIGMGILYLCTYGLFTIGWIVDIVKEIKRLTNS